mmetsp:Transcript_20754/g.62519  ORF Transcript_20754/g.62519 Transcript_20754/m.62519 type:complete len:243 (+) Transcript_20754:1973-2701(+)
MRKISDASKADKHEVERDRKDPLLTLKKSSDCMPLCIMFHTSQVRCTQMVAAGSPECLLSGTAVRSTRKGYRRHPPLLLRRRLLHLPMAAVPPTRLVPRHQTRPPAARSVPRHLMALCQIHCRSHCCRRSHPPQRHCRRRRRQLRGSQCQTRCPFHHPPRLPRLAERYWQRWLTQTRHQTAQPWLHCRKQPRKGRVPGDQLGLLSRLQTRRPSVARMVPARQLWAGKLLQRQMRTFALAAAI